ncbi:hypothetical protein C9423_00395 [Lactobacillus sp. Koumiss]|nr:hypothetical protein C9423_00395 [Lactobacillus sp. Koumiss]RYT04532.1 hypothetical protein EAI85_10295 [Enterococcus durans]HCB28869.1 hypothetical protein [Enterococcus sp.]
MSHSLLLVCFAKFQLYLSLPTLNVEEPKKLVPIVVPKNTKKDTLHNLERARKVRIKVTRLTHHPSHN